MNALPLRATFRPALHHVNWVFTLPQCALCKIVNSTSDPAETRSSPETRSSSGPLDMSADNLEHPHHATRAADYAERHRSDRAPKSEQLARHGFPFCILPGHKSRIAQFFPL